MIEIVCGWRRRNGYPVHVYCRDAGVERRDAAERADPVRGHLPPSLQGVSLEDAETVTDGDGATSRPWWSLPFSTVGGDDGGNRADSASDEALSALASLHSAVPFVAAVGTVPGGVSEYHLVLRSLCSNALELCVAVRGGGRCGSLDAQLGAAKSRLTAVRGDVRDAHADRLEELAPGAGDALRGRGRGAALLRRCLGVDAATAGGAVPEDAVTAAAAMRAGRDRQPVTRSCGPGSSGATPATSCRRACGTLPRC